MISSLTYRKNILHKIIFKLILLLQKKYASRNHTKKKKMKEKKEIYQSICLVRRLYIFKK